jgi:hypothetical protein
VRLGAWVRVRGFRVGLECPPPENYLSLGLWVGVG